MYIYIYICISLYIYIYIHIYIYIYTNVWVATTEVRCGITRSRTRVVEVRPCLASISKKTSQYVLYRLLSFVV